MYYNDFKSWAEENKDKVFRLSVYSKAPTEQREFYDCDIFVRIKDVIALPNGDFLIWFTQLDTNEEYYISHKLSAPTVA